MKALSLLLFIAVLVAATSARAVDVTFQVRMAYQVDLGNFNPGSDFVDLAGTFNDWGTNPLTPLADADGDTVYQVVLSGFSQSEQIEYKFRINGQWDGSEEFPGAGNNRYYTVPAATTRTNSHGGTTRSSMRSSCGASTTVMVTGSATSRV